MPSLFKAGRLPAITVWLAVALAVYYFAVFQRLSYRAAGRDKELTNAWQKFVAVGQAGSATQGLNLTNCEELLRQMQAGATNLATAGRLVQSRIGLPAEVRAKMREPFWLIDFQNERFQRTAQLAQLAKEKGVALEPGATNGLPEYLADMPTPELLWPRLYMANHLLLTAVQCKVGTLRSLNQLPSISHRAAATRSLFLEELPMHLELIGPMDSVSRFLVSLPLLATELQAVGLAPGLTNKPALFIDQVLLRKYAPDRPHDVQLELTVCGFVPWIEEAGKLESAKP
jgi:hypothetical protein